MIVLRVSCGGDTPIVDSYCSLFCYAAGRETSSPDVDAVWICLSSMVHRTRTHRTVEPLQSKSAPCVRTTPPHAAEKLELLVRPIRELTELSPPKERPHVDHSPNSLYSPSRLISKVINSTSPSRLETPFGHILIHVNSVIFNDIGAPLDCCELAKSHGICSAFFQTKNCIASVYLAFMHLVALDFSGVWLSLQVQGRIQAF